VTHRWITSSADLSALVETAAAQPRYALDTEFHRERTYFPKLALVQIAVDDDIALVDPLRCDMSLLRGLFTSESVAVLHAAQQDLDVLHHSVGAVPTRMYDTQLAAGFLGYSTPSLVSLLQSELKVNAAKGDRLTDWLRRPLTEEQCQYAAADVAHLAALQDVLHAKLDSLGRVEWAAEAFGELLRKPVSGTDPDSAWTRLKDVRVLKPRARGVARAVAAWRERRAMATDTPVRQVLPDLAVLGVAQRQPRTVAELSQARGIDERHTRGSIAKELLEAVAIGATEEVQLPAPDGEDLERTMRPAVALVSAWVDADARLAHGWRQTMIGDGIQRLVSGGAALTFDGRGGLDLVDLPGAGT